jgi:hypothetical protein
MRAARFFWFLLSILVGLGGGLAYGWLWHPPAATNLAPGSLRADYQADYVLMVAEVYHQDGNLPQALRRLTQLNSQLTPARSVAEALLTARDLEYEPDDLALLSGLAQAVQAGGAEITASPGTTATRVP